MNIVYSKSQKIVLVFSLLALVFSGCKAYRPSVDNEYRHSNFNYKNIREANIIAGPVISNMGEPEERRAHYNQWTRLLWNSISKYAPHLISMPPEYLQRKMGNSYNRMRDAFEQNGYLEEEDLKYLGTILDGAPKIIVLSRIMYDDIFYSKNEKTDSTDEVIEIVLKTRRKITARTEIYDITSRYLLWSGDMTFSAVKTKSYNAKSDRGGGWFGNILHDILRDNREVYPEPPSASYILEDIFRSVAKILPKPE